MPRLSGLTRRVAAVSTVHELEEDIGKIALIIDSEGNHIGLHQPK